MVMLGGLTRIQMLSVGNCVRSGISGASQIYGNPRLTRSMLNSRDGPFYCLVGR